MIVAVASGKGGTGKTTVASSLAVTWNSPVQVVDLDVEAPNLHLFLHPEITGRRSAYLTVPEADQEKCTACRACSDLCQFKAVSVMGEYVLVFPEMCHGCGGCLAVCPTGALTETFRELGQVEEGRRGEIKFLMGRLRVGEAMSPPLMRQVFRMLDTSRDVIIDAPPGTSCPAMTAVSEADFILLVSEPTPFGFHDLKLAREAFEPLEVPMGLVVNRAGLGDRSIYGYARDTDLPILLEIPYSQEAAQAYSQGQIVAETIPSLRDDFVGLAAAISDLGRNRSREAINA